MFVFVSVFVMDEQVWWSDVYTETYLVVLKLLLLFLMVVVPLQQRQVVLVFGEFDALRLYLHWDDCYKDALVVSLCLINASVVACCKKNHRKWVFVCVFQCNLKCSAYKNVHVIDQVSVAQIQKFTMLSCVKYLMIFRFLLLLA